MHDYHSAVVALTNVINRGKPLDTSFASGDSALAKQIAYGVLRHYYELNLIIDKLLSKPLAKKHRDVHILLLSGVYSVNHLNRPAHASVNAVVETCAMFKKQWSKKLVNGVLRQYLRQKEQIDDSIKSNSEASSNHPLWLFDRIVMAYPEQASDIFAANNIQAPMTLRVNLAKIDRLDYQTLLEKNGISSSLGKYSPSAIILSQAVSIEKLHGFAEGLVSVQDEASQLVAPLLNLKPDLEVLDACAAPGGKSCHMLEICPGISLNALDINQKRLIMIRQNLDRLGLSCLTLASDLLDFTPKQKFDRILLDAPCSASGIIRRHPDIKLLRRDSDIDKLAATQLELLVKAWSLLKQDGELVYSTCSILPTENQAVLKAFLEMNASAIPIPIQSSWGTEAGIGKVLLPSLSYFEGSSKMPITNDQAIINKTANTTANTTIDSPDGFFFAKLKKQSK